MSNQPLIPAEQPGPGASAVAVRVDQGRGVNAPAEAEAPIINRNTDTRMDEKLATHLDYPPIDSGGRTTEVDYRGVSGLPPTAMRIGTQSADTGVGSETANDTYFEPHGR